MYYGIVGVSGLAFACALELFPDINRGMKLVPFNEEFRFKMVVSMLVDYAVCWVIEFVLKRAFSDFRPRDIAVRRDDQLLREKVRKEAEAAKKEIEEEKKREEKNREWEQKVEERRRKVREWRAGSRQ